QGVVPECACASYEEAIPGRLVLVVESLSANRPGQKFGVVFAYCKQHRQKTRGSNSTGCELWTNYEYDKNTNFRAHKRPCRFHPFEVENRCHIPTQKTLETHRFFLPTVHVLHTCTNWYALRP